ncbi:immunoglobulin domain-containing protein [Salmon gill poxvirus]|nr:immunoglobulin domain-containing protein [Salmon gill poxvirus]
MIFFLTGLLVVLCRVSSDDYVHVTAFENTDIELPCFQDEEGTYLRETVKFWTKDCNGSLQTNQCDIVSYNKNFYYDKDQNDRHRIVFKNQQTGGPGDMSLMIHKLKVSDTGDYLCAARLSVIWQWRWKIVIFKKYKIHVISTQFVMYMVLVGTCCVMLSVGGMFFLHKWYVSRKEKKHNEENNSISEDVG